jgi:hypothetical protein
MGLIEESQRIECVLEEPDNRLATETYLHPFSGPTVVELVRTLFAEGISVRFRAKGTIMSPFIKLEDLLVLSPLGTRSPSIGDIVIFVEPRTQRLFIQRVIKRTENSYLLRGDNAREPTGIVARTNILGLVTKVERGGKRILFGLGPERVLIAFLSRKGLLRRLYHSLDRSFSSLWDRGRGY